MGDRYVQLDGWSRQTRSITQRFHDFGASSPERALTLGDIGRELALCDAEKAVRADWMRRASRTRFYVTDRGRAGLAGQPTPERTKRERWWSRRDIVAELQS